MRTAWLAAALLLLLAPPGNATDVYRWVDADGIVHLSDQPAPGAVKIRIESVTTYKAPAPPANGAAATPKPGAKSAARIYDAVEVVSPAQQEVLWNIAGQVKVSIRVTPGLKSGHSVRLYLDDKQVEDTPADATEFELKNVMRGVHTLRAEILGEKDETLITSSIVSFAVRQTSVIRPGSP